MDLQKKPIAAMGWTDRDRSSSGVPLAKDCAECSPLDADYPAVDHGLWMIRGERHPRLRNCEGIFSFKEECQGLSLLQGNYREEDHGIWMVRGGRCA